MYFETAMVKHNGFELDFSNVMCFTMHFFVNITQLL